MTRLYNFSAGPAILPQEVLAQAAHDLPDYQGMGASLLEMSHRGPVVVNLVEETTALLRSLLRVPDTHEVLFLQGGGRLQFSMVPMNLLGAAAEACYIINGAWSRAAAIEAAKLCHINVFSPPPGKGLPLPESILVPNDAAYLYYCQNETIHGIEFNYVPPAPECVPLVSDVSSNFLTRPIDFKKHALVFAAAQKNLAPAGMAVVIVRKDLLGLAGEDTPAMMNYSVHAKAHSEYNTPPVFCIWMANLVLKWTERQGGVPEMQKRAKERSDIVYHAIDASGGFYVNNVVPAERSRTNVVFAVKDPVLTPLFVREAQKEGLVNLKGHRLVGGLRASLYNAMPLEGAKTLANFMADFLERHG